MSAFRSCLLGVPIPNHTHPIHFSVFCALCECCPFIWALLKNRLLDRFAKIFGLALASSDFRAQVKFRADVAIQGFLVPWAWFEIAHWVVLLYVLGHRVAYLDIDGPASIAVVTNVHRGVVEAWILADEFFAGWAALVLGVFFVKRHKINVFFVFDLGGLRLFSNIIRKYLLVGALIYSGLFLTWSYFHRF